MVQHAFAVANTNIDSEMIVRHAQTVLDLARFNSDANTSGTFGSCDHRIEVRALCIAELHLRATRVLEVCLAAHATVCGTSDATTRDAVKDWVRQRLMRETAILEMSLIPPHGENCPVSDLKHEATGEVSAAMARVDDAFDILHHDRIERARRAINRGFRRLFRFDDTGGAIHQGASR